MWICCPKHKFHGPKTVRYAAASVVLAFNGGSSRSVGLMEKLATPAFNAAVKSFQKKDKRRIRKAEKAQDEKEKKRGAVVNQLRVVREETLREMEGVTYESGGF